MQIEIGPNLLQLALAFISLAGTIAGYYFGYKRGRNNSQVKDKDNGT
jgi:hypothetical protein